MNKSQRTWICFPWHGFRLNSRALNPDIRLSFSPKPQWAEKSTKHGNTTHRDISLFCLMICSFVAKSSLWPSRSRWKTSPSLVFALCTWWMRKKENKRGKDKESAFRHKGQCTPPRKSGREGKKLTSSEEGGGDGSIVPSFLTLCVCVSLWLQEWLNAEASHSIQTEES